MRLMKLPAICALIVVGLSWSGPGIQSQELPIRTLPQDCIIEPARIPQPGEVGNLATPSPTPSPMVIGDGRPAEDATTTAVLERVELAIACHNAGDVLRMLANFSERWVEERFRGYDLVFYVRFQEAAQHPDPLPVEDWLELVAVEDVLLLDDGRAAATVTTRFQGKEQVSLVVLAEEAGAWLIDGGEITPN